MLEAKGRGPAHVAELAPGNYAIHISNEGTILIFEFSVQEDRQAGLERLGSETDS